MSTRPKPPGGRRAEMITAPVASGTASLVRDSSRPNAWVVEVDGTRQSHVDLDRPTDLGFDYMRRIGHVIDVHWPSNDPLDAVHLGGGGLALPRFIAASRPGSRQRAFELDTKLTELVRAELPLQRSWQIRVRGIDAREGLGRLREQTADLVVNDVYSQARIPAHLASIELMQNAQRVLRSEGLYIANIIDKPPLAFSKIQVANATAAFTHVALIVPGGILKGRHHGNLVLVAGGVPLPAGRLAQLCAADLHSSQVVTGDALGRFRGGAVPVTDAQAQASPVIAR